MLKPEFLKAIRCLHDAQVDFVVIGGVAMQLHGGAHLTEDIDFSFAPTEENRERLAATINTLHPRVRVLNLQTDLGGIDLLPLPSGIDSFAGLWNRAAVMEIDEMTVRVASLDDLMAMKTAAGRPKDQRHLMELSALKRIVAEEEGQEA